MIAHADNEGDARAALRLSAHVPWCMCVTVADVAVVASTVVTMMMMMTFMMVQKMFDGRCSPSEATRNHDKVLRLGAAKRKRFSTGVPIPLSALFPVFRSVVSPSREEGRRVKQQNTEDVFLCNPF